MTRKPSYRVWMAVSACAMLALACGLYIDLGQEATPTPPPFQIPTGIPPATAALPPTAPPSEPTAQPDPASQPTLEATATAQGADVMAEARDLYLKGYLPFPNGQLLTLDDFSLTAPALEVFHFKRSGRQAQNFALWADIVLDSRGETTYPDYTGCGFAYRVQNNTQGYTAILTNSAVRMGHCKDGLSTCELFGTTFGSGEVKVANGVKTKFALVVNQTSAYVIVNDREVGQYSLFTTKLLGSGDIYYGVVSNVNGGYWSACQISNVRVWESLP
ncbi:MAG: hypothetical protein HY869_05810 [Chloroflexi bacterium]|nr:hypothetical protein [Chloroflexota bacterium]